MDLSQYVNSKQLAVPTMSIKPLYFKLKCIKKKNLKIYWGVKIDHPK